MSGDRQGNNPLDQLILPAESDYLLFPIPNDVDGSASLVVEAYVGGSAELRESTLQRVTEEQASVLCVYAEWMAAYAVRTDSLDLLRSALLALAIGAPRGDWQYELMR